MQDQENGTPMPETDAYAFDPSTDLLARMLTRLYPWAF